MIIVADESVDSLIIHKIGEKGVKVFSIAVESSGINDSMVLETANKYKSLLLTEDKDFGELTYRLNRPHHGILLLRLNDMERLQRIDFSVEMIYKHYEKLEDCFSVLSPKGLRIKKPNIRKK